MDNIQYNYLSKIPKEWIDTNGQNINIGVCDTGCNINHKAISHAIKEYKVFGGNTNKEHGTHVVGIISAKPDDISSVRGLASSSDVYIAGISTKSSTSYRTLIKALQWIRKKEISVLNLSIAYLDDNVEILKLLKDISKSTLIISSYSDNLLYPHSYDCVVSVGIKSKMADINYIGEFISTSTNNRYRKMKGSSMSTAFISSVACLAKSFDRGITKDEFLLQISGSKEIDFKKNNNIICCHQSNHLNIHFD